MADHDNGAMVRLAATIARSRYEEDGGTLLGGIHPETIMEMALAAKREVDRLRAELLASEDFDRVVRDHLDARSDEPTLDAIRRLRAENARLREAMPSDEERFNLGMALDSKRDAFLLVRTWLARLDAARKGE